MEEGRNGKQKVTRTLLVTSLSICAGLFLFMVFGDISVMKEAGGKYLHYDFSRDAAPKPLVGRINPAETSAINIRTAVPELPQEQPPLRAAGETTPENAPEQADRTSVADAGPSGGRLAPQGSSAAGPSDERPAPQGSSAAGPSVAGVTPRTPSAAGSKTAVVTRKTAPPPAASSIAASSSARAVKVRSGGRAQPAKQNSPLLLTAELAMQDLTTQDSAARGAANPAIGGILGAGLGKVDDKLRDGADSLTREAEALKEKEPPPTCANCHGVYIRGRYDPNRIGQFSCNGSVCRTCSGVTPATACTAFCLNGKENLWGSPKDGLPDVKTFTKAELTRYAALFAHFGFKIPESCTCKRAMFSAASSYGMGYSDGSCRNCVALPSPPSNDEKYYFSACRTADWCSAHCGKR